VEREARMKEYVVAAAGERARNERVGDNENM
jgi:hypothetical protein